MMFTTVLLLSCADEDLQPIVTQDNLGFGTYPRLVELVSGEFDLNNLSSTVYEYEVEFVSQSKGSNVQSYEIEVLLNGDNRTLYKSFGQADFTDNANGFKSIRVAIPLSDLVSLFGIAENDLEPLDRFTFDTRIITEDGKVFTYDNSTAAINGSAFQGHFKFNSTVTCPLPDTDFVGGYTWTSSDPGTFGDPILGSSTQDVTLELISGSTTKRSLPDLPYLGDPGLGFTLTLDFVCDKVIIPDADLGTGCSGLIEFEQGTLTNFDINDDSSITFELVDNVSSDCGEEPATVTVTLTKK